MSVMISPGMRAAAGTAGLAGGPDVTLAGVAGASGAISIFVDGAGAAPSVAVAEAVTTGLGLNIGAGCEPRCISSALIRIAPIAQTPTATPNASRPLHPD